MSVTVQRSLHHRADGVALLDVVPVPGLGAAAAGGGVLGLDGVDLVVGVVRRLDGVVLLLLPGLAALGADHQPVLPRQHRAVVVAEDVGRPLVHRPIGELARLVEHRHQRVAAPDAVVGSQGRPPLARARRVERVDTAQRVTLHQLALVLGDRGDLVLADERVPAHQRWRRDRTAPDRRGGVLGIAVERVVVAVGLGHDAERVRVGAVVVRSARPRFGYADAGAQACDGLVGDGPRRRLGHRSMEYTMRPPGAPGAVEQEHA